MVDLASGNVGGPLCNGEGDGGRGADPPEGGRRDGAPFRSQSDTTVEPYMALIAIDTGEATIVHNPGSSRGDSWVSIFDGWDVFVSPDGEVLAKRPSLTELERVARNLERANKRAVAALRRYCVRNELQKMLTLTYADEMWDRATVKRDMNGLFVRWRHLKGDAAFPYAYVLELHPWGTACTCTWLYLCGTSTNIGCKRLGVMDSFTIEIQSRYESAIRGSDRGACLATSRSMFRRI